MMLSSASFSIKGRAQWSRTSESSAALAGAVMTMGATTGAATTVVNPKANSAVLFAVQREKTVITNHLIKSFVLYLPKDYLFSLFGVTIRRSDIGSLRRNADAIAFHLVAI